MQKQKKPLKTLSFFLGLGILCTSTSISAEQLSASVTNREELSLTSVRDMSATPAVDDEISILGKNFGTDEAKLKVVFPDKTYSPEVSYGNMLTLKLEKDMRSGFITIEKEIETDDDTTETIQSNEFYLDLKEPQLSKIDAANGLVAGEEINIIGENLGNTAFWCNETEFEITTEKDTSVTLEIPDAFLECSIVAKKSGFEVDTEEELELSPIVTVGQIVFSGSKFGVYGKGFEAYKNSLDDLELVFADGSSLKNPTYEHDGSIYFEKDNTLIPASGSASLEAGDTLSPQFEYTAVGSFMKILDVFDLRNLDSTVDFQIELGGSLGDKSRADVFLNGSELDFTGSTVESSSQPNLKGTAWIELNDWKSEVFYYEFDHGAQPIIDSIKVNNHLNFEVFGENFGSGIALMSVSSSVGDLEVDEARNSSARITSKIDDDDDDDDDDAKEYVAPEGEFSLSVSNKWGNSNSITFTLPVEAGTIFYATPEITEVEAIEGLARDRSVYILGDNLLKTTSVKLDGISSPATVINRHRIQTTIPNSAELTGKLFVINSDGSESNEIEYELFTTEQLKATKLDFPVGSEVSTLMQSEEWQDIFSFSVQNTEKAFDIDLAEFNFTEKGPLPIIELQLVDSEAKVIEDVKIDLFQEDKKIKIRELNIPVNLENTIFTLQGKIFEQLEANRSFQFALGNLIAEDIEIEKQASDAQVNFTATEIINKFCREISGDDWQTCRTRVRRPME